MVRAPLAVVWWLVVGTASFVAPARVCVVRTAADSPPHTVVHVAASDDHDDDGDDDERTFAGTTLRACVEAAESMRFDKIEFAIPGGSQQVQIPLQHTLEISSPLLLDGCSQPQPSGARRNGSCSIDEPGVTPLPILLKGDLSSGGELCLTGTISMLHVSPSAAGVSDARFYTPGHGGYCYGPQAGCTRAGLIA